jgi:hypothetical protein
LGASAKASSAVQLLLMMTPDHDPELGCSLCPFSANPNARKKNTMQIAGKLILILFPPEPFTFTHFHLVRYFHNRRPR